MSPPTPEPGRRRTGRRRWVAVATAGVVAGALGLGGVRAPVAAQPDDGPADAFGGFNLKGRANGLQVSYNVENVFPLPPPLFQLSVPEAVATTVSGPTSTAFGSMAYPGNALGNLPAIMEQSSPGNGQFVPPYPLAARADHPAGPPETSQDIGTASSRVQASEAGADAVTAMAAAGVPGLIDFGTVTTSGHTGFEGGQAVARSRSEVSGITLLFGLIHIDSIVTDLVATTDGTAAATGGTTTIGTITVAGLPATLGPDGLLVTEPAPPADAGPTAPLVDQLPLGQLGGGLQQATAPVNAAFQELLSQAGGSLDELLARAGIRLQVLEPVSVVDGPEASITANGVLVDLTYDGRGDNPLAQLLAAIPSEALPAEGIPGFPLNTSPQAMVNLLKETHVQGVALAYGTAEVVASPAFSFTATPFRPTAAAGAGGSAGLGTPGSTAFSTPTPAAASGAGAQAVATQPAGALGGAAIGAMVVILALLSSPLWAVGSRRLADGVLAAAGTGCPAGLDGPLPQDPPPRRSR